MDPPFCCTHDALLNFEATWDMNTPNGFYCDGGISCCPDGTWVCADDAIDPAIGYQTAICANGEVIQANYYFCDDDPDDGDCCTWDDYLQFMTDNGQCFGGMGCCPDGTITCMNDAIDPLLGYQTMTCNGEEIEHPK